MYVFPCIIHSLCILSIAQYTPTVTCTGNIDANVAHVSSACMPTRGHTSAPVSSAVWTWCHGHCICTSYTLYRWSEQWSQNCTYVHMHIQGNHPVLTHGRVCPTQCETCWPTLTQQKRSLGNLQWRTESSSHLLQISTAACMFVWSHLGWLLSPSALHIWSSFSQFSFLCQFLEAKAHPVP